MESATDFHELKTLLEWQLEMGACEAILDAPVDRYSLAEEVPKKLAVKAKGMPLEPLAPDAVAIARQAAAAAGDLAALHTALANFGLCQLKKGARNTVFSSGNPAAKVMLIGEAPGRDEDIQGLPFVGPAGQLLDRMLAAIGLSRSAEAVENAAYITNVSPWRPPQNREPTPDEMAMLGPFLERHIELIKPKILVLMGNTPCQALLGRRGIIRMRGKWARALNLPVMPMFHPAYLLRNPAAKREAWADLLEIKAKLGEQV